MIKMPGRSGQISASLFNADSHKMKNEHMDAAGGIEYGVACMSDILWHLLRVYALDDIF